GDAEDQGIFANEAVEAGLSEPEGGALHGQPSPVEMGVRHQGFGDAQPGGPQQQLGTVHQRCYVVVRPESHRQAAVELPAVGGDQGIRQCPPLAGGGDIDEAVVLDGAVGVYPVAVGDFLVGPEVGDGPAAAGFAVE